MKTLKGGGKSVKKKSKLMSGWEAEERRQRSGGGEGDSTYIIGPMVPGPSHTSGSAPPFSTFPQLIPAPE